MWGYKKVWGEMGKSVLRCVGGEGICGERCGGKSGEVC